MTRHSEDEYSPLTIRFGRGIRVIYHWLDDEKLSRSTTLKWISDRVDRPPSVLAEASILFLLSVLLLNPSNISPTLTNALGLLPATCQSLSDLFESEIVSSQKGLGKKKEITFRKEINRKWLDYWIIYGTTLMVESVLTQEVLLTMIPIWWALKALWIYWFLIRFLDEKRDNSKPQPLRLRPRSIIATKDQPSPDSTPESPEDDQETEDEFEETDEDSLSDHTPFPVERHTSRNLSSRELAQIMKESSSPGLSITPVGKDTYGVTPLPDSAESSSFDDSEGSNRSNQFSDESSDDLEDDASARGMSPQSQNGSTRSYDSYDSDDSNDVIAIDPDTPLDELALRGKKTRILDSPTSSISEEEELESDQSNVDSHVNEREDGSKATKEIEEIAKKEETTKIAREVDQSKEVKDVGHGEVNEILAEAHSEKPKGKLDLDALKKDQNPAKMVEEIRPIPGESGPEPEIHQEDTSKEDKSLVQASIEITDLPGEAKQTQMSTKDEMSRRPPNVHDGEVVKLSLEDLLALEEEGKGKVGQGQGANEDVHVNKTAPLEVRRKSKDEQK
ncbi:uncharacterized protein IL334_007117 [Kwoniella shivajii]|uniref:Uncharacterized protein n=1 Tax=Kwoniella shivajii TaxID=564305 RepID=A0ABZ1D8K7_9TREE|nr:hypothetical protein IL334_007117 [Kwoniella shivajii]